MTYARDFPRRRRPSLLALLVATVLSLVACSPTSPHTQVATSGCNENVVLFGCGTFASVSAADGAADVNWVADGAVTLTTELLNGRNTLVVLTPCNVLNIPMDVTADYLEPVEIAGTLRGCDVERTAQQRWVEELFSGVVSWSKDGNELTLIRDDQSMTLTSS